MENYMKKLSIIIPVYNVKTYLQQCLDSVVNQSYQNKEIILIDDGSTDGSGEICDKYAADYSCVKVVHKDNGGATSAYMLGIEKSQGECLTFIDSDDWIEHNMYEKMMPCFNEADVNMVFCRYDRVFDNGSEVVDFGIEQGFYDSDSAEIFFHKINKKFVSVSRWNKIYLTSDIKSMLPYLCSDIRYAEDNLFNQLFAMKFLRKAYYLDEVLYHYRFNVNSVSTKFNAKKLDDLNQVYNLLKKYDDNNKFDRLINSFYIEFSRRVFDGIYRSNETDAAKIKLIKAFMKQANLKRAIANGEWVCYNLNQRIKKFLIKHKMARTYFLLMKRKRK